MARRCCLLLCALLVICEASTAGFYSDNGVDQTIMYRSMPKQERNEMQQEILSLLGLHHRPNPASHAANLTSYSAPRYMIDLYETLTGDEEDVNLETVKRRYLPQPRERGELAQDYTFLTSSYFVQDADMIMSFVNQVKHEYPLRHDRDRIFRFDMSEVPLGETVLGAELRIYKNSSLDGHIENNITVNVYQLVPGIDPEDRQLVLADSYTVSHDHAGWLTFNVTQATQDWTSDAFANYGFYIQAICGHKSLEMHEASLVTRYGPEGKLPFMVAFFAAAAQSQSHVRRKRAPRRRQESSNVAATDNYEWTTYYEYKSAQRSCQRRELYVSFKDLGWEDWIIAPDGYSAFYCYGECAFPLNARMNASNHAIVQTLVNLMKPDSVPKPCCVPTKLSAIQVLYYDKNSNVILKKYRNMIVKACGCH
ncbi:PREDICTED: bone morphogenetic protein 7-like [Priapulus caudatus]|uniref:Bone morphogenetic protein 7-like n=1 Tax=Priapulus caudatus TaxID=37621 RepID=A0ABM1EKN2_PRICU|nr:PREDICTED: bone morphogenetic protein 7-like [Priapulus caudatus]XP_014672754.1 PREDICTED: bone morphogenetic protein 7-like [Priapulus caudatus]